MSGGFTVFGLEIRYYGILIAIGMFLAGYLGSKLAKRDPELPEDVVEDVAFWVIILGVIGARFYYVLFEWSYYSQHPNEILAIRNGGLAIHGGIIFGALTLLIYCRKKKIPFFRLADILAAVLPLAQSIGRWGNFTNKEAHGGPTDLPWAININGEMVHPTFLYESIWDFLLFLFLYFYLSKKKKFDGQIMSLYFIFYSFARFFIEGLRTDSLYLGPIRVAQLISIIFIVFGIILYYVLSKKRKKDE